MTDRRCPYEVLGVARDATLDDIKKAFRELAKQWHPDVNPNKDKAECEARISELYNAYELLKDPERRAAYDRDGFTDDAGEQGWGGFSWEDLIAIIEGENIADTIVRLARKHATLFHDPDREAYARVKVGGHHETYRVNGRAFGSWARHLYYNDKKKSVNATSLAQAIATLAMLAEREGEEVLVHVRTAEHGGAIYLDIGDKDWKAIKVTAAGWEIVADPPVRFVRSGSTRPLPMPVKGGSIEALRKYVNVQPRDEETGADEFVLLVAYALAALRPNSNYPVLVLAGEHGSGKSSLFRFLGALVDPREPVLRTVPSEERNLIVAARHAHLLSFDNLSNLPEWLSDAISRLSTGGGQSERTLYTNTDETTFSGKRPVCLNGITDVAVRPDLVSRAIMLALAPITSVRDEKDMELAFAAEAPAIFGVLLDGVVSGLLNLADVVISDPKPRMLDAAKWGEASTRAYWPAGTYLAAYQAAAAEANEIVIEASPVAHAIRRLMVDRDRWDGTATDLLATLTLLVPETAARESSWPKNARALSARLRSAAPPLRKIGIELHKGHSGDHRWERRITIVKRKAPGFASATAAEPRKPENARKGNGLGADAKAGAGPTQAPGADANAGRPDRADASEGPPTPADTTSGAPEESGNPPKTNGFLQVTDATDAADANSSTSSASIVPAEPECDTEPGRDVNGCDISAICNISATDGEDIPEFLRRKPEPVCRRCGVAANAHGPLIPSGENGSAGLFHARCWTEERTQGPRRSGGRRVRVEIKEVMPPGLGPPGDDVFDLE
jgi:DnaJ domain